MTDKSEFLKDFKELLEKHGANFELEAYQRIIVYFDDPEKELIDLGQIF